MDKPGLSVFSSSISIWWYCIPNRHIKERAVNAGIPEFQSAFLISILGISGFFARAGHGYLIDRNIVHVTTLYCFATFSAAIALPFIAIAEHYAAFVICAWFVGFGAGLYITLEFVIMKHMVGVDRFPGGIGIAMVLVACSAMSAVAISGMCLTKKQRNTNKKRTNKNIQTNKQLNKQINK